MSVAVPGTTAPLEGPDGPTATTERRTARLAGIVAALSVAGVTARGAELAAPLRSVQAQLRAHAPDYAAQLAQLHALAAEGIALAAQLGVANPVDDSGGAWTARADLLALTVARQLRDELLAQGLSLTLYQALAPAAEGA